MLWGFWGDFGQVCRVFETGQLLVALFEYFGGTDETRLMKEDAGAIEEEPGDGQVDDDRDVDGLAEAGFGALVVEGVQQVNEFVLVEFSEAAGAHLYRLVGRCGFGRSLE